MLPNCSVQVPWVRKEDDCAFQSRLPDASFGRHAQLQLASKGQSCATAPRFLKETPMASIGAISEARISRVQLTVLTPTCPRAR